ncbi:helix-turn-helix domain-containing protein [Streptomyces thermolilacinus]|uniref:Transcriptional regulator n=1 Tax=Streptomyces thermolilacinus SPC6 TaxID=1306406 RepID=A0A1D3DN38_9ACTN|nr:helix-turn-helix domain-containing protein [Streptomyces thermolilacinus]OEJ93739.1 transcriptional regulator [Streptomyces thermolilacinus SPC6]
MAADDRASSESDLSTFLELLELLGREAPDSAFDQVVADARRSGASPAGLRRLVRAKDAALAVRDRLDRRRQRESGLAALVDTARDLSLPYGPDGVLKTVVRRARLLLGADMAWVALHDPDGRRSRVCASDGHVTADTLGCVVPALGGAGRGATRRRGPFWTADHLHDDAFAHVPALDDLAHAEGLHAVMAVPLRTEGAGGQETASGVLYVADRRVRHFTPDETALMSALGDLAAAALDRARLLERTRAENGALASGAARARQGLAAARTSRQVLDRLLDLVLTGRDLQAVAMEAAELLGVPELLVRDPAGRRLAAVGAAPDEPGAPGLLARVLDAHAEGRPVRSGGGGWVCPATAGDELLGTLHVVPAAPLGAHGLDLLRTAARALAVALLVRRSAGTDGRVRDLLFGDLLKGGDAPPEQLAERARRLDVDLDRPHVLVVARPEGGTGGRAAVWASSYAYRTSGLKAVDGDCLVMMLPGTDPGSAGEALSAELSAVLGRPVTVGSAGPATDPAGIVAAHREARRCLEAVTALGGVGVAASPRELGFLGLLLSDSPNTVGFVRRAIGPVLDYDTQQCTELARTLEAYFASACSPSRAAETLHVHPNTVSRRLERVTELLSPGWQEPSRALEVQLALQLWRTRQALVRRRDQPDRAIG